MVLPCSFLLEWACLLLSILSEVEQVQQMEQPFNMSDYLWVADGDFRGVSRLQRTGPGWRAPIIACELT